MKKLIILIVVVAALAAGIMFWWGNVNDANAPGSTSGTSDNQSSSAPPSDVKSLVSYTLPSGWQEGSCPNDTVTRTYIVPQGAQLDCQADPKAPISLLVDPRATKDCQHVTAPQGVLSHTCKSLFIDGHKTLLASTEYPKSDLYPTHQTITDYFIDTGKGVVQVQYTYGAKGTNTYQAAFDQLVQTMQVR